MLWVDWQTRGMVRDTLGGWGGNRGDEEWLVLRGKAGLLALTGFFGMSAGVTQGERRR